MTEQPTFENVVDDIYQITDPLPPDDALDALTACIMGTADRCADSDRALLAVFARISNLIRFRSGEGPSEVKAMPLEDWIAEAWLE